MKIFSNEKIKELIFKLPIICVYIFALYISSGKTRILMAVLLLASLVCIFFGKKKKQQMILLFISVFILLGIYAMVLGKEDLFFYHTTSQRLYQSSFYEQQIFPDVYVRELIAEKTVIVPYEIKTYDMYKHEGDGFANKYFRENNYVRIFKEYAKDCLVDESLPNIELFKEQEVVDLSDFSCYGCANDMLRYSFLLNQEKGKEMSYFWYSWYYYAFSEEKNWYPNVYINPDGVEGADSLVAIWDNRENLYIMSKDYYEEKVKV